MLTCAKNRFRYGKMEFGTPSRFIKDIDPSLVSVEQADDNIFENNYSSKARTPFNNSQYQNSRPVASQFRSDPQRRIVQHKEERSVDPFSDSFKRTLAAERSGLRRMPQSPAPQSANSSSANNGGNRMIAEGNIIEHERFGIGNVIRVEGTGENTKATVQFKNAGTKQLLLKFARFKVIG